MLATWPRIATLCVVLAACAFLVPRAAAQSWYIDPARPALRTGPGMNHRITAFIPMGERVVEIIAENEEWAHVRLASGKEGWMRKSYVVNVKPSNLRLEALQRRHAELETKAARLEEENRTLKDQNEQISTSLSTKTSAMETLNRDFSELQKDADAKSFQMRKYLIFFFQRGRHPVHWDPPGPGDEAPEAQIHVYGLTPPP
jgi:uncharacterized protein YgiM (DUF1202 family)